jgi:hypothetical protein
MAAGDGPEFCPGVVPTTMRELSSESRVDGSEQSPTNSIFVPGAGIGR